MGDNTIKYEMLTYNTQLDTSLYDELHNTIMMLEREVYKPSTRMYKGGWKNKKAGRK